MKALRRLAQPELDIAYADHSMLNNEGQPSVFMAEKHRKYNAKHYYQSGTAFEVMRDPSRTPEAQKAYDRFISGLEKVNQQEYLKEEFLGRDHDLARWERIIAQRSNASNARHFEEQVKKRAEMFRKGEAKCYLANDKQHKMVKGLPPIRKKTAEYLVRPIEVDFNKGQCLLLFLTIGVLLYNIVIQVMFL